MYDELKFSHSNAKFNHNDRIMIDLSVGYELAALCNSVIEQTGLYQEKIINRALFFYFLEIFMKIDIKQIITWIFLDKRDQFILSKIIEWFGISEENLIYQLFGF